jgi:TRAP-type mannitol/chloroaromatic compound transport system permease large subunit
MDLEPWQFLVLAQVIIFLLGWPLEWSEILIIFVPIFLPLLEVFGVNPYFFAMLVALNLQTSFLTPPMAMSAYYLKGVLKKQIELMEIFRGHHALSRHRHPDHGDHVPVPRQSHCGSLTISSVSYVP